MHGYEMIQVLAERTGGAWKPSPGSIYPSLQLLEDEGFVQVDEASGKRLFTLTDAGRKELADNPRERTPWEEVTAGFDPADTHLRDLVGQIIVATRQVGEAGSAEHKAKATELLTATRRSLYAILAEPE
jgi:DNA-binding PadR family transcriptional regulator